MVVYNIADDGKWHPMSGMCLRNKKIQDQEEIEDMGCTLAKDIVLSRVWQQEKNSSARVLVSCPARE